LTADRNTQSRAGKDFSAPVAAATKIYAGSIVCLDASGNAVPASTATTLTPVGRAKAQVDNSAGLAGAKSIEIERGVFKYANSAAADEITRAQIGDACYLVDDQTVAKTNGGATRSRAGLIVDVDADGQVWVELGLIPGADPSGALLAANNLSDLGTPATARTNLGGGANKMPITVTPAVSLVGASAAVVRWVSPVAGNIDKIHTVIDGALTTGDATITAAIGGVAVTNGVVTITQAGSAAGDKDSATPSAAKTVAVGDLVTFTVGGTNDAAKNAAISILITPTA
jgi:hypothetical protein